VKLSPDLSNDELAALCRKINESKTFRGVVLTNTSGCLAEQLYGHKQGGLSGEPLFDRAIECVELARKTLSSQKLIIGVGGITSGERAYKMRKAGADLLEIYTGFVSRGPKIIIEILKAIRPLEN